MEQEYMTLRNGSTYVNIYRRSDKYIASLYGQLKMFGEGDVFEKDSLVDLIIYFTLTQCSINLPLEVYDKQENTWSPL